MTKIIFVTLIVIILQACSEFYAYHPPAPIYKKPQATNPYIDKSGNPPRPVAIIKKIAPLPEYKIKKSNLPVIDSLPKAKPLSPAIISLVKEAEKNSQAGDFESAVSTIERALRIEPRSPVLTYKLAQLRLKQSKPRLAEDLAKKAALLSAHDKSLKRQSWLLISEARKRQNNEYGAKEARIKADNI